MSVRRKLTWTFVAAAAAFVVGWFLVPKVGELGHTWKRVSAGDKTWLLVAVGFEVLSFVGYVVLFRAVFVRSQSRIDWRESYQITMAGLAATRLLAAGGAGGVALTAWALKRSGMDGRTVTRRMTSFLVILYGIYMAALLVDGAGLASGLFGIHASAAVTIAPAAFGGIVIAGALMMARLRPLAVAPVDGSGRGFRARVRHVTLSIAAGVRGALGLVRSREPGLVGGFAWWGFDIAVLWASFHAFGAAPPVAVIVMGYFVGTLANTLPLPGGVGGVDGGMIGAFLAFGVDPATAVLAVLSYRAIAFWLPTLPGLIAYFQLRRTMGEWRAEDEATEPVAAPGRIAVA
ncbi:MAG TPA: lysylphosphatidylglycerol synthase transmembrane domain-containing protein [Thermoleophilaceae bacterium]|nr:lysylphosphatidylglycerol synthase transmembrane domain-containing protein [Thermoleophilaceae bacterium]